MKRAILYTRVSTDDQAENGTSLSVQLSTCLKKAEAMGLQVVRHFEDAGVSGALFQTRPSIQQALAAIEAGEADTLIVYSISRLSRDREHQSIITRRVERTGGRIVYCDMATEDTPESKLLVNITGDFAEYERQLLRKRSMAGRQKRAEDGIQPARSAYMRPFGYTIPTQADVLHGRHTLAEVGRYILVAEEAHWVAEIFRRYAAGDSLRSVCKWLVVQGVSNVRGGDMWRPATIKRILDNTVYKGKATFGRRANVHDETLIERGFKRTIRVVERPEAEWTYIDAPPIVSEAVWNACQKRLRGAQQLYSGNSKRKNLLTGLLLCPKCRRSMRGHRQVRKNNRLEHYYHCRDSHSSCNAMGKVCWSTHIPGATAEAVTLNVVRQLAHRPELVETALQAYAEATHKTDTERDIERIKEALADLARREKATVQAQIRGIQSGADPSVYDELFAEIREKRSGLMTRLGELETLRQVIGTKEAAGDTASLLAQAMADVEEALTAPEILVAERHGLLARIIAEIIPDGDVFRFRLREPVGSSQTVSFISILLPLGAT